MSIATLVAESIFAKGNIQLSHNANSVLRIVKNYNSQDCYSLNVSLLELDLFLLKLKLDISKEVFLSEHT